MTSAVLPSLSVSRGRAFASAVVLMLAATLSVVGLAPPAAADDSPFQVTMVPSSPTVASGDQLTYTITVHNSGGDVADDAMLTTQLNGLTGLIVTSDRGYCEQTENDVTCFAGTLTGFDTWRVTIRGTVTAPDGVTLFNGVTVTGNHESSGYETSVYSNVLVDNDATGPLPDLRISVQGPSTMPQGSTANLTYQLTVNNTGNSNATGITVFNHLPNNFSFVSANAGSLFSCVNQPAGSRTVVCSGGRLNAGSNATITIVGAPGAHALGEQLKNTAVVDPYDQIAEAGELNNTASLITTVTAPTAPPPASLRIDSFTDAPDPLRPGDKLTYTIVAKNAAATRADNVVLTDVTQGLDASSIVATTTKGTCTVTAPKVTCTQKSPTLRLDPTQTMTVTITGTVTAPANSLITNTVTVAGVVKNKSVTHSARSTTTVRPGVDLTVVQVARTNHHDDDDTPGTTDPFRAWDHFQYDVSVGNSGIDPETQNVVFREVVAPGVQLLSVDPNGDDADIEADVDDDSYPGEASNEIECGQDGTVITCVIPVITGTLDFGTLQQFTLHVVSPPTTGVITATGTIDPGNAVFEGDETNNVSTVQTDVKTGVDLTVTKHSQLKDDGSGLQALVAPSGTLTYTITVSNVGTQDVTGVKIRDVLPAGTRFRWVTEDKPSGDPGHNFTCSHDGSATGGDVTCVGGRLRGTHDHNLPVDFAVIKLVVFAPAPPGLIRNQVRVDPDDTVPELLETNNINNVYTDIGIGGVDAFHEFRITKEQTSPADGKVAPSGVVEYDLDVFNDGSDVAFNVKVEDVIPTGFVFRHAEDTQQGVGDFECSHAGGVITCTGGTLDGSTGQTPAAGDTTRTIHVSLFAATQPGLYKNKASIDPGNAIPEANETNNSAEFDTTVVLGGGGDFVDLTVDSTQSSPVGAVVPSGMLQYTLKVKNTGSAVAFNTTVQDTLPEGAVFRDATDNEPGAGAFECTHSNGVVTCTGGTLDGTTGDTPLANDDEREIVINLFAPTEPNGYVNTAVVDPGDAIDESDETNNTDTTTTTVSMSGNGKYRDLEVSAGTASAADAADGDTAKPEPGREYTYEITVKNTGTNPAFNLVTRHVLDEGASFVRAEAENDFTCTIAANVLTCDGGVLDGSANLANQDTDAVITITARAPQRHDWQYALTSRIDPANAVPESDEGNNSRQTKATVFSRVDLELESLTSDGEQGGDGTVDFTVKNNGDREVNDVVAVVQMPVGVIPQDFTTVQDGWSCSIEENPINRVICHGPLSGGGTATFQVKTYVTADGITANGYVDPDDLVVETDSNTPTNNNAKSG